MSAKNRSGKDSSYDLDDYPTPAWCVHRLLDKVQFKGNFWLEPCAGDGSLIRAINSHWSVAGVHWHANEIQERYAAALKATRSVQNVFQTDIREWTDEGPKFDVFITNPPFSLAEDVLHAGFRVARTVVLLLRINFFGSKHRHGWLSRTMPKLTCVLPDRPAFRVSKNTGKLGTDATEYAWFVWEAPWAGRTRGEIMLLDRTNDSVLEEDRARIRAGARNRTRNGSHTDSPSEPEAT